MTTPCAPTRRRSAVATLIVSTVFGIACSWWAGSGPPILRARWRLLAILGVWAGAWLVGVGAALRTPTKLAVGIVLVGAVGVRLVALAGPPTTSDDVYRYAWDGRVQAAGADPYAEPPLSPTLSGLRDRWLWPGTRGCAALDRPPGCTRLNRPAERSIYPPVAEGWFRIVDGVAGDGARHKAWQVAGLAGDVVTVGLLLLALDRWGRDRRWIALYALCPAPAFEFVHNAHVDGLAVAFLVCALLVTIPPPGRRRGAGAHAWRDVFFGLLVGAAALVKVYPVAVLLVAIALPRPRPWHALARASAAATLLAAVAYLPHVLTVGVRVLGYLPGYLREEHYDGGGRFLLAGILGLSGEAAGVASVLALAVAAGWVVWRRPDAPRAAAALLAALFLATTPVQPWYAVSVVALASLAAWPRPTAVAAAGYPYYFAVILDFRHTVGLGRMSYLVAAAIVLGPAVPFGVAHRAVDFGRAAEGRLSGSSPGSTGKPISSAVTRE